MLPENFIVANDEAKIFNSMPEVKNYVLDKKILSPYPFISEFAKVKFSKIKINTLTSHLNEGIEICYVHKGRYEWVTEDKSYILLPGDGFVTCPWEKHGSRYGFLDLGILSWIIIKPKFFSKEEELMLGDWSRISLEEQIKIGNTLKTKSCNRFREPKLAKVLSNLFIELVEPKIGSYAQVLNYIEELLIYTVRGLITSMSEEKCEREFNVEKLKNLLLTDINRSWTIEEMAEHMNYGITRFIELCKRKTGLTPINLLIEMRIIKAIEMMKSTTASLTDISYDCGFSSIQHFSDTFKKHTGYSPTQYKCLLQKLNGEKS